MPASGKTTVGQIIAHNTGFKFIDLDLLIEKNEGMSISEIFNKKGEKYFRLLETDTLKTLLNEENMVLSTGGGTIKCKENLEMLKRLGRIYYLEIKPEDIYQRIKNDKTRPLLQKQNPKQALMQLFGSRKQNYEKADCKIDALLEPEKIADYVVEKYEKFKSKNRK